MIRNKIEDLIESFAYGVVIRVEDWVYLRKGSK